MRKMNKLKLGLPLGSLLNSTLALFKKAGYNIRASERNYTPTCDDRKLKLRLLGRKRWPVTLKTEQLTQA